MTTQFLLQFRDAESDLCLQELEAAYPLPAPVRGDTVKLFRCWQTGEELFYTGVVERRELAYQPREGNAHFPSTIRQYTRVWLQRSTA